MMPLGLWADRNHPTKVVVTEMQTGPGQRGPRQARRDMAKINDRRRDVMWLRRRPRVSHKNSKIEYSATAGKSKGSRTGEVEMRKCNQRSGDATLTNSVSDSPRYVEACQRSLTLELDLDCNLAASRPSPSPPSVGFSTACRLHRGALPILVRLKREARRPSK